ncbi:MAG: Ig-like domain-containing protein [Lachnospiraceae bacterium]|nr:Ig-like domain-containing protein [Lachnospiraceae bacterium]
MQKSRIHKYLAWLLIFAFVCSSVFVTTGNAEAAGKKNIKSVIVRINGKKVTKKTVTLRKGRKTTWKVSVSPRKGKKHVTYTSSKKSVATVSKKGKVTAKKAGTAKIKITVSGKGYKKKTTWVKIRVVNSKNTSSDTGDTNTPVPNSTTPDTPTSDTPEPSTPTQVPNTPEPNEPTPDVQPPVTGNEKSLVVYFSRTGNTKAVAEQIQSLTGSDLVELKTVVPYPSSYGECLAQAQEERANNARPELSTTISNMSEYDTVYVGYPIWCYTAPMAIFTFLESYDFTGKTVIPFCTSGSSSITQSVTEIRSVCSGITVLDGFRAGGSETVEDWLTRIGQIGNQNTTADNVLIAYFSLSENTSSSKEEQSGSLDAVSSASVVTDGENAYGNTEYIAKLIQDKTGGTLHQIQTKETYSTDFDEVIDQNHAEMNTSSLPELKDSDLDISQYEIVFIGYPVWSSTIPRAIHSFLNQYDLSGKTVIPFCTHNGYGSGNSYRTIASLCPDATNLDGLAVPAVDVKEAGSSVESWLDGLDLSFRKERNITVKTGELVLEGILYDTELAKEISTNFPLTVSLGGYGGREYYGSLPWTPQTTAAGQYSFEDGEITYCAQNNTIAIFYAQTSRPNLTMEVVPIGKVTSDLSVFDTLPSRAEFTFAFSTSIN